MNTRMHRNGLALSLALVSGALLPGCRSGNYGETTSQDRGYRSDSWYTVNDEGDRARPASMPGDDGMAAHCRTLKSQSESLMAEMKAQDAALAEQLATMNGASDENKVGLLAAVVTRLVEERAALDARLENLHQSMMQHMSQHLQAGKDSLSQCPMMKSGESTQLQARNSRN